MTDTTVIDIERARAEKKSPILLWGLNILWPGLGNLVIGQIVAGLVFGVVQWWFLFITFLTGGLGGFLCFLNWIAASAIGHQWINKRYVKVLEEIRSKQTSGGGTA